MELIGLMKNNKIKYLIWVIIFASVFFACENKKKQVESTEKSGIPVVAENIFVPDFNSDSAYSYVDKQVSFGPRVPNSKSHIACGNYLTKFFANNSDWVIPQEFPAKAFDGKVLQLKNIIASYNPKASRRIILASHWDSRPFADQDRNDQKTPIDGANDGASGVGILMEIARQIHISEKKPDVGIDFILFDGEYYGQPHFYQAPYQNDSWCLGSQHWSANKHTTNYSAYYGILLDMVGAKNATFAREGVSLENAPSVVEKVWQSGQRIGYGNYFINIQSPGITDDHTYVNKLAMIPMIDIIEFDTRGQNYFGSYWHTHNDNMSVIDKNTLKAVGQTLLEVVYREKL